MRRGLVSIIAFAACLLAGPAQGQVADAPDASIAGIPVNYTEAKVGNYTLPDPLKLNNGQPVKDAKTWNEQRRPELLKYYQSEIYGRIPATAPKITWQVVSNDNNALNGTAVMKELAGYRGGSDGPAIKVTLYTPAHAGKPVPALVSISFNFTAGARGRGAGVVATNSATSTNAPRGGARGFGDRSAGRRRN